MKSTSENLSKFHPSKKEIFGGEKSFRLLLAASSGSGKSQVIKELLTNPSFGLTQKFQPNNVYIVCPTLKVDPAYDDYIIPSLEARSSKDHQFDKYTQTFHQNLEQSLATIYEDIVEKNMGKKESQQGMEDFLIICDDVLLEIDLSSAHSQVARMLSKMRHYQISMIISSQFLKILHPIARSQITHFICFSTSQSQEVMKIAQECSGGISLKQFQDIYRFCVDSPYNYLLVIMGFPSKYRFFSGNGSDIQQIQV